MNSVAHHEHAVEKQKHYEVKQIKGVVYIQLANETFIEWIFLRGRVISS